MRLEVVIITGLSGAGKSVAIKCMEDIGYFCIDNLPPSLLGKMIELSTFSESKIERIGVVIDVRGRPFFHEMREMLRSLKEWEIPHRIIFLEASDEVLVRRYKESKRAHPLSMEKSITESIGEERELLSSIKEEADLVIDTSELNIYQLREHLQRYFSEVAPPDTLQVVMVSFGYKFGVPMDADIVFDVRFLSNPFWVEELRDLDGFDRKVIDYVLRNAEAKKFVSDFQKLINFLLPLYAREGKAFLTVAIGCTGGRHRSVVITEKLSKKLQNNGVRVFVRHRDLHRR